MPNPRIVRYPQNLTELYRLILASNGASTEEKVTKDIVTQGEVSKSESGLKVLSDADRAKSRAERFGVVTSTNVDEKKAARAARFGTSNSSKKIGNVLS